MLANNRATDTTIWVALLVVSCLIILAVFILLPAIPQDLRFHDFADRRTFLSIPNFSNVVSNLPFLMTGIMGLRFVVQQHNSPVFKGLEQAYRVFFTGVFVVGVGSSYYHLNPTNETLVWDRLPMAIAFMAFFAIVLGENISNALCQRILYPAVFIGVASVVYWYWSEQHGQGDLRYYGLIQFLPMLIIPTILVIVRSKNHYIYGLLAAYALAKLAELGDGFIYRQSGFISGHTIKHLLAAWGIWYFLTGKKIQMR